MSTSVFSWFESKAESTITSPAKVAFCEVSKVKAVVVTLPAVGVLNTILEFVSPPDNSIYVLEDEPAFM